MSDDIALLLSRRLAVEEPPFLLDPAEAMERGTKMRTVRRRQHIGLAVASSVVACLGVTATVAAVDLRGNADVATSNVPAIYDAENMPQVLEQVARDEFGTSLDGLTMDFKAMGNGGNRVLAAGELDEASSMELSFSANAEHRLSIYVAHARGEAEGDLDKACSGLRGWSSAAVVQCDTRLIEDTPVLTTVLITAAPMRNNPGSELWGMLSMASDEVIAAQGPDLYFDRTVKVVRSNTIVTYVREVVHARNFQEAEQRFRWSPAALTAVATDPRLAFPQPRVS